MALPRIFYENHIAPGVVILPSSEQSGLGRSALLRPSISDVLRFKAGFTFVSGVNDSINFDEGGLDLLGIDAGQYATGAALATQLEAEFEAADSTPVWDVSHNPTTGVLTISTAAHPFSLLFLTGTLAFRSAAGDLGFAEIDTPSGLSAVGAVGVFQGRHWITVDLGEAKTFSSVLIAGHNVSAAGTVRFDAHASDLAGQALGTAVDFTVALTDLGGGIRGAFFASQTKRYLRLVIKDTTNTDGYGELAVWSTGPAPLELPGFAVDVTDARDELGEIAYAIQGAQHAVRRGTRRVWELRAHRIDDAKKVELETFADVVRVGVPFFFDFDGTGANVRYVFLDRGIVFESQETVPRTWTASLRLLEALG